jgi:uncharacterized membrane protein YbhN (UPF0104 family)
LKKQVKNVLKYVAFFFIGFLLLYLTYRGVDLGQMWADIKEANFIYLGISFVMGYLAIVSRGVRWVTLMEPLGYKPRTGNSVHAVAFGYFANLGIPRSGEVVRCTALYQSDGVPVDKLVGTVILERVIDSVFLLSFTILAFVLNVDVFKGFIDQIMIARDDAGTEIPGEKSFVWVYITLIGLVILITLFIILRRRIYASGLYLKFIKFFNGIKEGFQAIGKMKKKGWFIFHTCFIWLMYFFMAYVAFYSFPETSNLTLADGLFITVAGGMGMVIPAPGGTGSYHAAITLAFVALGLGGVLGVGYTDFKSAEMLGAKFAALLWTTQTLMIIVTGFTGFLILTLRNKNKVKPSES